MSNLTQEEKLLLQDMICHPGWMVFIGMLKKEEKQATELALNPGETEFHKGGVHMIRSVIETGENIYKELTAQRMEGQK